MGIHYKKAFLIFLSVATGQLLFSQEKVSKKVQKTFSMSNAGELHLENKYGDIYLNGWSKNSVEITVDIEVTHKNIDVAESNLDRISPKIKVANDFVSIVSEIAEKNSSLFAKYFSKVNPLDFDKSNVQINYTVYMPENAEFEVTNKFGDVIITDWSGKLKGDIQHGDIFINQNLSIADLSVKYGKLKGRNINYGNFRCKSASLYLGDLNDLRINSNGSTITAENVKSLEMYSSKDVVSIEEVGVIEGDIKFSNVAIKKLDKHVDLTMKIADFKVSKISTPDISILIDQVSSDINLNVEGTSFNFDAVLEEGLLRLPKTFKNVKSTMIDKGKRIRKIEASYGQNLKGRISILGKKGLIQLKEVSLQ